MSLITRIHGAATLLKLARYPLPSLQPTLARTASSRAPLNHLINEGIPHPVVQLVNPETRKPDPPTRLDALLAKLDRKGGDYYSLVDPSHTPAPLIVLRNRKIEFNKKKADKASAKAKKSETKIIEMTWSIEPGDLRHKLSKAKSHLEKGDSVEILFKPKPKVPLPEPDLRRNLATSVEEEMQALSSDVKKVTKGIATVITVKPSPSGTPGPEPPAAS
ncbi:hypothetical protein FRC01_010531 [Tulasnella sp. 417]|nr:hypothetical protein FRC01_010531 [Tulasnella sp. 417]